MLDLLHIVICRSSQQLSNTQHATRVSALVILLNDPSVRAVKVVMSRDRVSAPHPYPARDFPPTALTPHNVPVLSCYRQMLQSYTMTAMGFDVPVQN